MDVGVLALANPNRQRIDEIEVGVGVLRIEDFDPDTVAFAHIGAAGRRAQRQRYVFGALQVAIVFGTEREILRHIAVVESNDAAIEIDRIVLVERRGARDTDIDGNRLRAAQIVGSDQLNFNVVAFSALYHTIDQLQGSLGLGEGALSGSH